jgi:hypothetical protein
MKDFIGTEDEITLSAPIKTLMNDNIKYSTAEYRQALYQYIGAKYKDALIVSTVRTPVVSGKKSPTSATGLQKQSLTSKSNLNSSHAAQRPTPQPRIDASEPSTTNSEKNKDKHFVPSPSNAQLQKMGKKFDQTSPT